MSTDRETTRIVRSWLTEGVTVLPDRVLDAVLNQVPATHQRRSWWPAWRSNRMTRLTQYAIAAAAVLVVAVVGYNLLPRNTSSIGGQPTPSPTAAPIPSGSMAAGFYLVSDPTLTRIPWTFTAAAGWTGGDGANKGDSAGGTGAMLTTWLMGDVYSDACHWRGKFVPTPNRTVLAAALAAEAGLQHGTPTETTIGGLPATKVVISLSATFSASGCDNGHVHVWPDPGPDEGGGWAIYPGQTATIYAIDTASGPMVLFTVQHADTPAADVAQLNDMLASVRFEPAAAPTTSP